LGPSNKCWPDDVVHIANSLRYTLSKVVIGSLSLRLLLSKENIRKSEGFIKTTGKIP
jgi:hypothetical protein